MYIQIMRDAVSVQLYIIIMELIHFSDLIFHPIVAIITFGLNSSAYVAEIIRGNWLLIMDKWRQVDPGYAPWHGTRYNYSQAIKNILPH